MKYLSILVVFFVTSLAYANFLPKTFTLNFEQEYTSTLKGKSKKGEGFLDYKYPGKVYFQIEKPEKLIFVSNGKKTWFYRFPFIEGEPGELVVNAGKNANQFFGKFFDSLNNGLVTNPLYDVKNEEFNSKIIFSKNGQSELGIKEAAIIFIDKKKEFSQISEIELMTSESKKIKLKFKKVEMGKTIEDSKFEFTPPANTRVMN